MKNIVLIIVILISGSLWAQNTEKSRIPMLGEDAPKFVAESTKGKINFPDDYFNKWKIIFSHPADFTPVCSSEIIELSHLQDEFKKLNTQILILSTDGINSHMEWINSLESILYENLKTPKIDFPFISDVGLTISKQYGMIHPNSSKTKDVRGVFIINPENKVCAIMFYPMNVGRNIDEILRTVIALQHADNSTYLTPANWVKGEDLLLYPPKSIEESNKLEYKNNDKYYSYAWYMWFKKE